MVNHNLKNKSDMHWTRKAWHLLGVSFLAWVYYTFSKVNSGLIFLALAFAIIPLDFLRLKAPALNQIFTKYFKYIMRKSESDHLTGSTHLILGVLIIHLIFPREIVLISILFLAFADPLASVFGIKFGKDKIFNQKKSIQGSLAAYFICSIITFSVLSKYGFYVDYIAIISILAGLIGAIAEAIPIGKIDDNFTIPVISSIGLTVLFYIFNFISSYPMN